MHRQSMVCSQRLTFGSGGAAGGVADGVK